MIIKEILFGLILICFLGCSSDVKKEPLQIGVDSTYQKAIKEELLKDEKDAKYYQELSWKKMQCSERVAKRIGKNAIFISHSFKGKNIYGGMIEKEHIYFFGDAKPKLLIDFNIKIAFDEFLANEFIGKLFENSVWDFKTLHASFKKSDNDTSSKEMIKDFIYSIRLFGKADLDFLTEAISNANNPMSISKNLAIFMTTRIFPELVEELLFNEVTYQGKYK